MSLSFILKVEESSANDPEIDMKPLPVGGPHDYMSGS